MTAMYADLVTSLADEFTVQLGGSEAANDDGERLFDRLWSAGLLDIEDVVGLLLRRAEEERISAGIRSSRQNGKPRFLQSLVSDEQSEIAAAAMGLILARGRRRDRFDGPRLAFDDVSAESADRLASAIAAVLRSDLAGRFDSAEADERLAAARHGLLSRHDEGNRLEARIFDLVHSADLHGRLDEAMVLSALDEGEIAFVAESLARRSGIDFDSAWNHLTGGSDRLALLLRLSGASREFAGELVSAIGEIAGADPESAIDCFDGLSDEEVEGARKWLRLDPSYRAAVGSLDTANGQRPV